MASHLNLIRNSRVFISTTDQNGDMKAANTFELNVLDGFSFTQTTATAEITLNEAGTNPDRGKKSYNTARNPVDWSFTTYVRPYKREATPSGGSTTKHTSALEKLLWEAFLGKGRTSGTNTDLLWTPFANFSEGATTAGMTGDTDDSDVDVLLPLYIFFELSDGTNKTYYRINKALVNTAEIDFSIDGIAQIAWGGQGETLEEVAASDMPTSGTNKFMPIANATAGETLTGTHGVGVSGGAQKIFPAEFIRNKLSTVSLMNADTSKYYNIVLTGGSISLDNGVTYLTPDELGVVNTPIGGFTGTRSISGTMNCYLRSGGSGSGGSSDPYDSGKLIEDLLAATTDTDNKYVLTLAMGGAEAPKVDFTFAQAQLEVPSIDVADVISTTVNFVAEGSAITTADEMDVKYLATL